jgi:hypothetical protein
MLDKAPATRTEVTPDEKAWADFWGTVSRLDLGSWKPAYDPQDTAKEGESISIMDGMSWRVSMGKEQKLISSKGDNAYPTIGQPTHTTLESAAIDELFKAFNRLVDSAAPK